MSQIARTSSSFPRWVTIACMLAWRSSWPSPNGVGLMDKALYDQTINIATTYKVLKAAPADGAYRTDLAQKALDGLGTSVDTKGASFQKATVTLNEGGN